MIIERYRNITEELGPEDSIIQEIAENTLWSGQICLKGKSIYAYDAFWQPVVLNS